MSPKKRIGFIGVGLMGHGMAKNIVEKGYPAHGDRPSQPHSRSRTSSAAARWRPRRRARSPSARRSSSSASPARARSRRSSAARTGSTEGLKPGTVVVDCSTSDPDSTIALAAELAAIGVQLCRRAAVAHAEGGLGRHARHHGRRQRRGLRAHQAGARHLGRKVVHLGPVGDGHKMKLLNNFIVDGLCRDLCRGADARRRRSASRRSASTASSAAAAWIAASTRPS